MLCPTNIGKPIVSAGTTTNQGSVSAAQYNQQVNLVLVLGLPQSDVFMCLCFLALGLSEFELMYLDLLKVVVYILKTLPRIFGIFRLVVYFFTVHQDTSPFRTHISNSV